MQVMRTPSDSWRRPLARSEEHRPLIEDLSRATGTIARSTQVAVVGTGPAGTVVALELARRGVDVTVVESGLSHPDERTQALTEAAEYDASLHASLLLTQQRVLGGTSRIWGGRSLPFDPIDFESRPGLRDASWPVSYDEISRYFGDAAKWLECGRPVFSAYDVPTIADTFEPGIPDTGVRTSSLERWSLPIDMGHAYRRDLETQAHLTVLTGVTCVEIETLPESSVASAVICRNFAGGTLRVSAKVIVVAAGGLESTRILLASPGTRGGTLGNDSGHLGRWYMAHTCGVAASIRLHHPAKHAFDYVRDIDGSYVRRRFSFSESYLVENNLPNIVAWIDNPEAADASHESPELSMVYLVLSSRLGPRIVSDAMRLSITGTYIPGTPYGGSIRSPKSAHVANVVRHPVRAVRFGAEFGARRVLARGRKVPGYMSRDRRNIYPLEFHGEHLPSYDNRVWLTNETDELGMKRLGIKLTFSDSEIDGVRSAHEHWDRYLTDTGIGELLYLDSDVDEAIRRRMGGGFHQTGTTRMSATSSDGVVDRNLCVYGTSNVYVASGSTFVSSGHANPTFMIVAFAVRLASHLAVHPTLS